MQLLSAYFWCFIKDLLAIYADYGWEGMGDGDGEPRVAVPIHCIC